MVAKTEGVIAKWKREQRNEAWDEAWNKAWNECEKNMINELLKNNTIFEVSKMIKRNLINCLNM